MIVDGKKKCPACDQLLSTDKFYKQKRERGDGLSGYCKPCAKSKSAESSKQARIDDPEAVRAKDRQRVRPFDYGKHALKTYGVSEEDLLRMHQDQDYSCGICRKHVDDVAPSRLYIDHNHETGQVRGLLCMNCNTALGNFKDDIANVARALKWLEDR